MSHQIIKQPNDLYCVWSTVVDNVIYYDCTALEIIDLYTAKSKEEHTAKVNEITIKLKAGIKPYGQWTMDFDTMMEEIKERHGKDEANNVLTMIVK